VCGVFYGRSAQPRKSGKHRADRLRLAWQRMNLTKFSKLVCGEQWDLAINTHFLPAEIIAALRREGKCALPQVTATTDFETHRLWVNSPCELFFTATTEGALYLQSWGVPAGLTRVTGIPIHPVFAEDKDRADCRRRQGLVGDRPVVLQLAGGFGVGPIKRIFEQLLTVERPTEVAAGDARTQGVR